VVITAGAGAGFLDWRCGWAEMESTGWD